MAMAPKIDENIFRSEVQRQRAIENAGYQAAKSGCYSNLDNPYEDGDGEAWNDGFFECLDEEPDPGADW